MPLSSDPKALPALLLAALSLPAACAHADAAPDAASIAYKFLRYQDSQPGADRVRVTAPAVEVVLPVAGAWALDASDVIDTISGASPAYHTEVLKKLHDRRRATDLALSHYGDQLTLSAGASYSSEADYISRGLNLGGSWSTEDKNTTWNAGLSAQHDSINPTNHVVVEEHKNVAELAAGLTQVLGMADIAQLELGRSQGHGYFSDPYKVYDRRPRERDHSTLLLRWNHYIAATDGTSRLSYRYYDDSFGIRAHTVNAEYVQPLPAGWTLTPSLRFYTQTAADFYVERDPASDPFPTNPPRGALFYTEEQRLSAFGAHTLGLSLAKRFGAHWSADIKVERYEQRGDWARFGRGSANLAPFFARVAQFGVAYTF